MRSKILQLRQHICVLAHQHINMNLNIKAVQENTYDAIVVGSGISGGWAAKELCEKGLKALE